jgi:predicted acetyltransferase
VRAAAATRADALWIRLVDVPRALTARGYAHDIDEVFELTDALCPWNAGRWRLTVSGSDVRCEPTTDPPGVGLDVRDLATAYLGGPSLAAIAAAGLVVEHRRGAVANLSTALRGLTEPAVPAMF